MMTNRHNITSNIYNKKWKTGLIIKFHIPQLNQF